MNTTALKTALITGGAAGIGLGIARKLISDGLRVIVADRDPVACEQAANELRHDPVVVLNVNVDSEEGFQRAIDSAVSTYGGVDLLCNSVGFRPIGRIVDIALDEWRQAFRSNVDTAFIGARSVFSSMKERGGGSIVNLASISGLAPYVEGGAYASSKAALIMLTKVLAMEFGPEGIRVNCICPGSINRDENTDLPFSHIPIGRAGTPLDVGSLVSFLASDESSYITGAVIALDGGATAGREKP